MGNLTFRRSFRQWHMLKCCVSIPSGCTQSPLHSPRPHRTLSPLFSPVAFSISNTALVSSTTAHALLRRSPSASIPSSAIHIPLVPCPSWSNRATPRPHVVHASTAFNTVGSLSSSILPSLKLSSFKDSLTPSRRSHNSSICLSVIIVSHPF